MAWTRQEINVQWFGDQISALPDDAPEAFDCAERIRGLEWVLGREFDFGGMKPKSVCRSMQLLAQEVIPHFN